MNCELSAIPSDDVINPLWTGIYAANPTPLSVNTFGKLVTMYCALYKPAVTALRPNMLTEGER